MNRGVMSETWNCMSLWHMNRKTNDQMEWHSGIMVSMGRPGAFCVRCAGTMPLLVDYHSAYWLQLEIFKITL